jgi:hypothetical protein
MSDRGWREPLVGIVNQYKMEYCISESNLLKIWSLIAPSFVLSGIIKPWAIKDQILIRLV